MSERTFLNGGDRNCNVTAVGMQTAPASPKSQHAKCCYGRAYRLCPFVDSFPLNIPVAHTCILLFQTHVMDDQYYQRAIARGRRLYQQQIDPAHFVGPAPDIRAAYKVQMGKSNPANQNFNDVEHPPPGAS